MHSGIINFASGTALNIKDNDVKKEILTTIENLCKVKIIQKHSKLNNLYRCLFYQILLHFSKD